MVDRVHIEETLRLIPGVLSARVVGDAGDPSEIHVLAGSERHPKQIARDVESCLAAKFDLVVDHRKISVAQMEPVHERGAAPYPRCGHTQAPREPDAS